MSDFPDHSDEFPEHHLDSQDDIADPGLSDSSPSEEDDYWGQVAGAWVGPREPKPGDAARRPVARIRPGVYQPDTDSDLGDEWESKAKIKGKRGAGLPDDFESLPLTEALGYLVQFPAATAWRFWQVLTRDPAAVPEPVHAQDFDAADEEDDDRADDREDDDFPPDAPADTGLERLIADDESRSDDILSLLIRVLAQLDAVLCALWGGRQLHAAAIDPGLHMLGDTNGALTWFGRACVLYLGAEWWWSRDWWLRQWRRFFPQSADPANTHQQDNPSPESPEDRPEESGQSPVFDWFETHLARLSLIPPALLLTALAYGLNVARDSQDRIVNVQITTGGFVAWVLSVALWIAILGLDVRRIPRIRDRIVSARGGWRNDFSRHTPTLARIWPVLAILAITLFGLAFRLYDLSAVPPEMTSDHIEKLLDGLRVYEGNRSVFFPNNGGREGFQMYVVALMGGPLGMGFNFDTLKWATVIEGVITLPVLWWMARQVIGTETEQDRRLGNWVGLALAALVAVSAWHVMLSRLGLRIVLTPLTVALVIGFLARAMRYNRMGDFVALGVVLGAGVYFYQANRMLPLLVAAGIGLAVVGSVVGQRQHGRDALRVVMNGIWLAFFALLPPALTAGVGRMLDAESVGWWVILVALLWFSVVALIARAFDDPVLRYGGGLLGAAVIALALYVPMFHYSQLYPDQFWNRTRGRMFGEDAFVRIDPATGLRQTYEPSLTEQVERLWDQRATFQDNFEDALLMYQWEGDGAWINNPHSAPALDWIAGGLAVLGGVVWGVLTLRRRDPIAALIMLLLPVTALIMLLPSAMTLAYTVENPSFTRASGTIPPVFMLAALPVGMLAYTAAGWHIESLQVGRIAALAGLALVIVGGIEPNAKTFFTDYRLNYSHSWKPYHEISKPLREFAQGVGSYGNAFMVAYPHWLDHRILGTIAGDVRWPNGLVERDDLLDQMRRNQGTRYAYDPTRPLFVMYYPDDRDTAAYLDALFPGGTHTRYVYRYEALEPGHYETGGFIIFTAEVGEIDSLGAREP